MIDELGDDYVAAQLAGTRRRIAGYEAARRVKSRWMMTVGGAAIGFALTGGAVAVIQASTTEKTVSSCYSEATLSSAHADVGTARPDGTVHPKPQMQQRVRAAEEQCGVVWSIGTFSPEGSSDGTQYPVPDLFTCVLADGRLGVFPVDDEVTCATLDLRGP